MRTTLRWIPAALAGPLLFASIPASPSRGGDELLPVVYDIEWKGTQTLPDGTQLALRASGTLDWSVSANAFSLRATPHQPTPFYEYRGTGSAGVLEQRLVGLASFWFGPQTEPPLPPEEVPGRMLLRARLSKDGRSFRGRWTAVVPDVGGVVLYRGRIEGRAL